MKSSSLRPTELGAIAALAIVSIAIVIGFSYGIELSVLLLAASALGLVIALLWASVRNLTGDTPLSLDEALMLGAPSAEEEQKRAVLRALKDLEFERSVGKISEADYQEYSARYREEARRLMERVDASLGEAREIAEKLLSERVQLSNVEREDEPAPPRDEDGAGKDAKPAKATDAKAQATRGTQSARDERDDDEEDDDEDERDDDEEDDEEDDEFELTTEAEAIAGSKVERKAGALCRACQRSNDADAKFCKHCGAAIDGPPTTPAEGRQREEKTP